MTLFQSDVREFLGYGIPGEYSFDGPRRAQPGQIDPDATAVNCVFGRVFTLSRVTGLYRPGGDMEAQDVVFGGILSNPKEHANYGLLGEPLASSLILAPGKTGTFTTFCTGIVVVIKTQADVDDLGVYDVLTGEVGTIDPRGTPPDGWALIPNCTVYRTMTTAANAEGQLVSFKLTN